MHEKWANKKKGEEGEEKMCLSEMVRDKNYTAHTR
jgi:hypothetical protein